MNATSEEVDSTCGVWHHINLIPASQLRALQGSKRWGESISKVSSSYVNLTESNPVANTRRFTNARKNDSSSLVKPS